MTNGTGRTATPVSLGAWPGVTTGVATAWAVVNGMIRDIRPAWSLAFGLAGAILITALTPPLAAEYRGWRRSTIYVGLTVLNAAILAGAMIGVEETVAQGTDAGDSLP